MGQIPNKFGVLLGMGCDRFRTGSGQVWDRFRTRTGLEQIPNNFGILLETGSRQVWDRFGTRIGLGQILNNFEFCLGQVVTGSGQIRDKNRFGTDSRHVWGFSWDRFRTSLGQV